MFAETGKRQLLVVVFGFIQTKSLAITLNKWRPRRHDDVRTWTRFQHYRPFVWGSQHVVSLPKDRVMQNFDVFFVVNWTTCSKTVEFFGGALWYQHIWTLSLTPAPVMLPTKSAADISLMVVIMNGLIVSSYGKRKSRSREIDSLNYRLALKTDGHISSTVACQISDRSYDSKNRSRGLDTLRDLTIRRLIGYSNGAQKSISLANTLKNVSCQLKTYSCLYINDLIMFVCKHHFRYDLVNVLLNMLIMVWYIYRCDTHLRLSVSNNV